MFFGPFLAFYAILFFALLAGLFVMLENGLINYAFGALGLPPELALIALMTSLIGSYINIPIAEIESGEPYLAEIVSAFGIRYRVPLRYARGATTLAINVGRHSADTDFDLRLIAPARSNSSGQLNRCRRRAGRSSVGSTSARPRHSHPDVYSTDSSRSDCLGNGRSVRRPATC